MVGTRICICAEIDVHRFFVVLFLVAERNRDSRGGGTRTKAENNDMKTRFILCSVGVVVSAERAERCEKDEGHRTEDRDDGNDQHTDKKDI